MFRLEDLAAFGGWFRTAFGMMQFSNIPYGWQHYFDAQMITLIVVGILGATVWGLPRVQAAYHKITQSKIGYCVHEIILFALFILAIMFMVNSNYSPFIYFQY